MKKKKIAQSHRIYLSNGTEKCSECSFTPVLTPPLMFMQIT